MQLSGSIIAHARRSEANAAGDCFMNPMHQHTELFLCKMVIDGERNILFLIAPPWFPSEVGSVCHADKHLLSLQDPKLQVRQT